MESPRFAVDELPLLEVSKVQRTGTDSSFRGCEESTSIMCRMTAHLHSGNDVCFGLLPSVILGDSYSCGYLRMPCAPCTRKSFKGCRVLCTSSLWMFFFEFGFVPRKGWISLDLKDLLVQFRLLWSTRVGWERDLPHPWGCIYMQSSTLWQPCRPTVMWSSWHTIGAWSWNERQSIAWASVWPMFMWRRQLHDCDVTCALRQSSLGAQGCFMVQKVAKRDMGLSEKRVYSQWNSHLLGIMIINHWV